MEITCTACTEGTNSAGNSCTTCGGDGVINLADENIDKYTNQLGLHGVVWNDILDKLTDLADKVDDFDDKIDDIADKVDDVMDKCDDIFEKVDE